MKELLLKFLGSVIRSLFISAILFVVGFSAVTGEFPPNFKRIPLMFEQVQKLTQVSRQIHDKQKALNKQQMENGYVENADVEELQELQLRRAEIGTSILPQGPGTVSSQSPSGQDDETKARLNKLEQRMLHLESELQRLKEEKKN